MKKKEYRTKHENSQRLKINSKWESWTDFDKRKQDLFAKAYNLFGYIGMRGSVPPKGTNQSKKIKGNTFWNSTKKGQYVRAGV